MIVNLRDGRNICWSILLARTDVVENMSAFLTGKVEGEGEKGSTPVKSKSLKQPKWDIVQIKVGGRSEDR